jgi:hypothetical protein
MHFISHPRFQYDLADPMRLMSDRFRIQISADLQTYLGRHKPVLSYGSTHYDIRAHRPSKHESVNILWDHRRNPHAHYEDAKSVTRTEEEDSMTTSPSSGRQEHEEATLHYKITTSYWQSESH